MINIDIGERFCGILELSWLYNMVEVKFLLNIVGSVVFR